MSQITVPVQFDGEVIEIANDGTTATGFATVNGQTFIVSRAVRRFGEWHGSPIFPGFVVTTEAAMAEAQAEAQAVADLAGEAQADAGAADEEDEEEEDGTDALISIL